MRKNIVGFVGVNREESSTVEYIKDVISLVKEEIDVDMRLYTQSNFSLEICKGCSKCFLTHTCPLDYVDHMDQIKSDFINADFVIFGSPVYMHSVSGSMKNFLDRISYWSHIFPLRGKNCMLVSSAGSNGGELTTNYLEKITAYFGCPVATKANIFAIKGYDDGYKEKHAQIIVRCIDRPIKSNDRIEIIYQVLNSVMKQRAKLGYNVEYEYWKKNKLLNANSFEEVVTHLKE